LKQEILPPSQLVAEISPDLDHVVLTALARNPEERFQNARAMAFALTTVVPPAGPLEVATWMSRICGAMLRQRADRLSELEAVPIEELTQGLPVRSRLAPLMASSPERFGWVGGSAASVAEAGATAPPERAVLPAETLSRAPRRRRRAVTMSAAAAVLAISALGTTFFARRGESSEPTLQAVPIEATTSARSRETAVAVQGQVNVAAASPGAVGPEKGDVAAAPHRADATAALPAAAALPPVRRQAATPSARPAGSARTGTPPRAKKSSRACAIPFSFDHRGIKRFNPECF
jgi:hypothetical protein